MSTTAETKSSSIAAELPVKSSEDGTTKSKCLIQQCLNAKLQLDENTFVEVFREYLIKLI